MRGLYPIVDVDSLTKLGDSPQIIVEFAVRLLAVRPPVLQLRAKQAGARDALELLRLLRPLCSLAGTRLIANDRPDLAILAECDGVHVGQDDLPLPLVRHFAPGLIVGVSTHDLAQLAEALAQKPEYVAFGPIFSTASKERPGPSVGVDELSRAHDLARAAGVPLVAIGGINLTRATEIASHCEMAATISALRPNPSSLEGVSEAACALHLALTR